MTSHGSLARVVPMFATPVLTERWSGADEWNEALLAKILEHRSAEAGVTLSNVHGWQSATNMLEWGGEAAQKLVERVLGLCDAHTVDVREQGRLRFVWLPEMWANVNERGASNQMHCHPGSQWSAVYYVQDGYGGSTAAELGGEIAFVDPRFPMIRMRDPDLRYKRPDRSTEHHEAWVRPATGQLIMFPAWLWHYVRPYLGEGRRISIAMNIASRPRWEA